MLFLDLLLRRGFNVDVGVVEQNTREDKKISENI